jgi:hypothetical protein
VNIKIPLNLLTNIFLSVAEEIIQDIRSNNKKCSNNEEDIKYYKTK